jgi:aspartyl-tRNA(Asn)/glutamyl-tRNA(Gln) amidotransferase subunit B
LPEYDGAVLSEDRLVAEWFDETLRAGGEPKLTANWVINILFSLMNEHKQTIDRVRVTPAGLSELLGLLTSRAINNSTAKEVLAEMFVSGKAAPQIVAERGLSQISDEAALESAVAQVLAENPAQVAAYFGGKEALRGWFVGQVMKSTRGKADPAIVNDVLSRQLDRLR